MKRNKYVYLFVIQGNYGQGWEDVTAEESYKGARARLHEYDKNEPGTAHRIVRRREVNQRITPLIMH